MCFILLYNHGIRFFITMLSGSGFSAAAGRERPVKSKKKL
jgi:hypothetical protein